MASSSSPTHHLLLNLCLLFGLFSIGVNARPGVQFHPCKTLFISSFTITSFKPSLHPSLNPNSASSDQNPSRFVAVFSEIRDFRIRKPSGIFVDFDRRRDFVSESDFKLLPTIPYRSIEKPETRRPVVRFRSFGVSSLRERTEDILSVVIALLFGVGCGALTSATMYLAWSLITNRYEVREFEDDDTGDFGDVVSPKKMGYVKIPADAPLTASPVPAPAKEVV